MIELGNYNTLKIVRSTSVGLFLRDDEGTEVLLPNKYVPSDFEIDQELSVFCYLDNNERPIATKLKPLVIRNAFAFLEVVEVGDYGAFLDWGLEKHLLVPYREQETRMEVGKKYVVHCRMDEKTFRLIASSRINKYVSKEDINFDLNDRVSLLISRKTSLGWEAIIEGKFRGLIYFDDVFKPIGIGDKLDGYIKKIRPDNKVDLTLQPIGAKMIEPVAKSILEILEKHNGYLPIHDKSSPEEIKNTFQLSKKAFKKAIGSLYKQRKINIGQDGITLL